LKEIIYNGRGITPRNQQVSIVFIDIRGFSRLSEKLSPQEVSHLLCQNYFSPLDNIIHDFDGTLDKHIGDGIMGIFGAPVCREDDAVRAVFSAVKMRQEMIGINNKLMQKDKSISIGIGISTGEAMVGIFGSNRKKEYTGYGFTVNLAARLERLAGSNQILICDQTYRQVKGLVDAVKIEPVSIRGIEKKVELYSV
jgi:adenylate cyclase